MSLHNTDQTDVVDNPLKELVDTDKLIHEPSRLGILSWLDKAGEETFMALSRVTGLSRGNLTIQLDKLKEGGLIQPERVIRRRRTQTTVRLTAEGESAIRTYWARMEGFRERLCFWSARKSPGKES